MNVYFEGNYTDETCNAVINGGSNENTVFLPTISVSTLNNGTGETGSRVFDITMKDCPASRTITVYFNSDMSAADVATGNLLNSTGDEYSRNVQVRLRKEDGSQIIIDDATSGQDYHILADGSPVTHRFIASYFTKEKGSVTAGKVQAIAGIAFNYK